MRPRQERRSEASRLRKLRDALGLTQRELAAEFKVAHGAIAGWESGARTLPGPVLRLVELYEEELAMPASGDGFTRLKTSMGSRSFALSGAVATAVAHAAASLLLGMVTNDARASAIKTRAHIAMARHAARTLGNLKALAMKVGQTLAYVDFALPDAAQRELTLLLTSSRPMAPSTVSRIFLQEFGQPPARIFAEWSPAPFAAASIGQVHRARLPSGEEVAVKVQYPKIGDAIEADLRNARLIDQITARIFRRPEPGAFFAELRERLLEECDYRLEGERQEEFRRLWRGRPGVRIPRVFTEWSTQRILVTELVHAENFASFSARAAPGAKDRAGEIIWQFTFESIFRHGLFHADPHPGNYLFADGEVVFLDFGCVKRFPDALLTNWSALVRAVLERDAAAMRRCWIEMGFARSGERYDFDYDLRILQALFEPFLTDGAFQFSREHMKSLWRLLSVENPNKYRINVPKDWIMAERLHWGLYNVLARLDVRACFRPSMLDLIYEAGDRRPEAFSPREIASLSSATASLAAPEPTALEHP